MTTTVGAPSARLSPVVQYALLAGPLLSMLDSGVVNVAVEPIARQLHASLPLVQWTVVGYLLARRTGLAATAYLNRRLGAIPALHLTGVLIAAISAVSLLAAPLVPAERNQLRYGQ